MRILNLMCIKQMNAHKFEAEILWKFDYCFDLENQTMVQVTSQSILDHSELYTMHITMVLYCKF